MSSRAGAPWRVGTLLGGLVLVGLLGGRTIAGGAESPSSMATPTDLPRLRLAAVDPGADRAVFGVADRPLKLVKRREEISGLEGGVLDEVLPDRVVITITRPAERVRLWVFVMAPEAEESRVQTLLDRPPSATLPLTYGTPTPEQFGKSVPVDARRGPGADDISTTLKSAEPAAPAATPEPHS